MTESIEQILIMGNRHSKSKEVQLSPSDSLYRLLGPNYEEEWQKHMQRWEEKDKEWEQIRKQRKEGQLSGGMVLQAHYK